MKKLISIFTLIFIVSLFLFSCGKTKDEMIIGNWNGTYSKHHGSTTLSERATFEFFKDKTFETTSGDGSIKLGGQYQLIKDGKAVELTLKSESGETQIKSLEIFEITNEKLTLVNSKKDTFLLTKVTGS
jgi:hypothetical protein